MALTHSSTELAALNLLCRHPWPLEQGPAHCYRRQVRAIKIRKQIKDEYENGLVIEGDKTTFSEFAQSWHEARITNKEVGTSRLNREETIIGRLNRHIGDVRLRDLTLQIIESLYTQLKKDKLDEGGKCGGTTMNMTHKLLKQILFKAVVCDMILRNPCDRVKAPKCDTAERRLLTAEEPACCCRKSTRKSLSHTKNSTPWIAVRTTTARIRRDSPMREMFSAFASLWQPECAVEKSSDSHGEALTQLIRGYE